MKRLAAAVFVACIAYSTAAAASIDTTGVDLKADEITYRFISADEIEITARFSVLDGISGAATLNAPAASPIRSESRC